MAHDEARLTSGSVARIGIDSVIWALVVFGWQTVQAALPLFWLLIAAGLASIAPSWLRHAVGPETGYWLVGQLILAIPFVLLGFAAFTIGLFEGLTGLGPRPFFVGSAIGLLAAGVLGPRIIEHQRLAVLIPQAAVAGLVIVVAQVAGLLLSGLGTAPNKRIERTPSALS